MTEPHRAHASLPTRAVSFLVTGLEGSTGLREKDAERMRPVLVSARPTASSRARPDLYRPAAVPLHCAVGPVL